MALTQVNRTMITGLTKSDVGLSNVDNTTDAAKPVSTAVQTALDLKAPIASPTFTGTVGGVTKAMVGLGSVDNTSDAAKPISTATQTALDLKAPLASPTFTGTVSGVTKSMVGLGSVDNTSDASKPVSTAVQTELDLKAPIASPTFTGTVGGITKSMVSLGNVDNTSDANKPISTAQQTALDLKAPLASPALTGTPTAPTAAGTTNTTQIATTAMVQAAIATVTGGSVTGPGVSTDGGVAGFNGTGGTILKQLTATEIRAAASLATTDSPQFAGINVGNASDTTITRASAGVIAVEGVNVLLGSADIAIPTVVTVPNTGLHILDTDASHDLIVKPGSNLTADRTLTVTTGDADRSLDISAGSVTITAAGASILDDASVAAIATTLGLGTTDSPQHAAINLGHATDTTLTRVSAGVIAVEGATILTQTSPTLNTPTLNNAITVESYANNSSTNLAIDLANGTQQIITLTGNWVPNTGWPTPTAGQGFRLIIKQDGTGSRTITWPSSVKWPSSTAPTITATASKADILDFESDGTNWYGYVVGQVYL